MVLLEQSRAIRAYATRNTVNRLARNYKELHLKPVVLARTIKRGTNLNIELQKHKLDQIVQEKYKDFSRQAYSFLAVMLRRLRTKT